MTLNNSVAPDVETAVASALHEGLATAKQMGTSAVVAEHLASEQLESLIAATLTYLRSRPAKPSEIEGWSLVTSRDAAVMSWWAAVAGLTESERRRLASLRRDVYAVLVEQNLIQRGSGRSTSIHVSPAVATTEPTEPFGAWVLKLSPYVYDAERVFASPDGRVREWSVENHERAASMRYGDQVYLWVSEGDPYRAAGVWGVGYIAGPTFLGIADDGWLDFEAASRASMFAVVDITVLHAPVSREAFLDDVRLADAEVVRDPFAPNPGVLTAAEAEALLEYLPSVGEPAESQVA